MTQRKPTALWKITRAYRSTGLLTTHTNPQFSLISAQNPLRLWKSRALSFSPFKEEPAKNSIQISWIEREESYIALNDRLYFPKLPKQNGANHLIFDPIDRAQCSVSPPGLNGNYPFRLFLIYDKNRQTISFIMVGVSSIICHVFCLNVYNAFGKNT